METLVPPRRDDVLALFDAALASTDDRVRATGACCCLLYTLPAAIDFSARDAAANRVAMAARIDVGEMDGVVACDDEGVVGWLNLQGRHRAPHCFGRLGVDAAPLDVAPHDAAVALCMVLAARADPGVAGPALVRGAVDLAQARGFALVDVFPRRDAVTLAPHEPGPVAWYAAAGFVPLTDDGAGERAAMRRRLR